MKHTAADGVWQTLIHPAGDQRFDPSMVDGLPEPARRCLIHAIAPGTPLSTCVELDMEGRFRPKPAAKWMPMHADEMLTLPGGFVWRATVGGLMRIQGHDIYANAEGAMEWRLWGLFPVMRASGADISRSARGRLAAEAAAWLPAALLPDFGARWEAVDDHSARVTLEIDEELFSILIEIAPSGAIERLRLDRWGNVLTPNSEYTLIPSGGVCSEEGTFQGFTIPTGICGRWWTGTTREFEFFETRITAARYY